VQEVAVDLEEGEAHLLVEVEVVEEKVGNFCLGSIESLLMLL